MANPRFVWGIDIGNRALKAVKLVRENESFRLDDVDVIEHEQVLSNSGDNKEALIQTALANFAQRHPTKGGVVAVGVSGQASFARFIKLPPVEESKIPEIVRFEAIQQIPFPLDDVEWSYQLFRQPDNPDVEVGIFAMRKELVNQQIKYFSDMDMNVQVVQMNPLAVYNAMYNDQRVQDGTTMILDLGAENADLIIADGESVWLRSIPIGGNNFTEALVKSFKLNFTKAEDLKRNAQTSKYARQIFQAMRPIFADLVAEIQRSVGFYSSVHRDSRIKKIIALGNTFRLPTLQKYLQQNLQIEVERLDGFSAGSPEDGRVAAIMSENLASMASAYGLAIQAMGQAKITSSLLPRTIQMEKIWKEKTKWFVGAAAILLAAAGLKFGVYYTHRQQFEAKTEDRRVVDGTLNLGRAMDQAWGQIESSGGQEKAKIQNVMALTNYRDMWADLWLDITRALPEQTGSSPDKVKAIKRGERQQIFIDGAYTQYQSNMAKVLKLPDDEFKAMAKGIGPSQGGGGVFMPGEGEGGGGRFTPRGGMPAPAPNLDEGGVAAPAETAAESKRGFLLVLQCTSPSSTASTLVETNLVKKLAEELSEVKCLKKKSYYIAKAAIVSAGQIGTDEVRRATMIQAYEAKRAAKEKAEDLFRGGGGAGGGGGVFRPGMSPRGLTPMDETRMLRPDGGGPVVPRDVEGAEKDPKLAMAPFVDPMFQEENVLEDWQITVLIAIVLDPEKPQQTETPPPAENKDPANPEAMKSDPSAPGDQNQTAAMYR